MNIDCVGYHKWVELCILEDKIYVANSKYLGLAWFDDGEDDHDVHINISIPTYLSLNQGQPQVVYYKDVKYVTI